MKNLLVVILAFVLAGCSLQSTPETIYPTQMPTPTLAVVTKPISEADQESALEFFYHIKVHIISSEYEHIAEEVRYPITILVDGESKTYVYVSEFSADFDKIFTDEMVQTIVSTDESELTFTPDGVKMPDGTLTFNWLCTDPACNAAVFLITEINQ